MNFFTFVLAVLSPGLLGKKYCVGLADQGQLISIRYRNTVDGSAKRLAEHLLLPPYLQTQLCYSKRKSHAIPLLNSCWLSQVSAHKCMPRRLTPLFLQREADQSVTSPVVLSVWNEASEYLLSFSPWGSFPLYSVHQRQERVSSVWCTPTSSLSTFARSLSSLLGLNELISGNSWSHLIYVHCWQLLLFKERVLEDIAAEDWGKTATE